MKTTKKKRGLQREHLARRAQTTQSWPQRAANERSLGAVRGVEGSDLPNGRELDPVEVPGVRLPGVRPARVDLSPASVRPAEDLLRVVGRAADGLHGERLREAPAHDLGVDAAIRNGRRGQVVA